MVRFCKDPIADVEGGQEGISGEYFSIFIHKNICCGKKCALVKCF